ncbi:hypothetical protein SAMN04488069_11139 [Hymenobacter psychrophilus]|uniref:Uncharacterized protein n=2 Tax=Hymenobacter psychrophilus TaxID=651662 RepID=A0A1H3LLR4_9BACT|nr:hypothetical protein SAMN04488069_11139 [Hymenobacter psychrophilus]
MKQFKWLVFCIGLAMSPSQLLGQKTAKKPAVKSPVGGDFVFPVARDTQLITYHDTIRVAGASAKTILDRFVDTYYKNFLYADRDTANRLRPRQKAAPGETVLVGMAMLAHPGERPIFVAGITPPEALRHAPPVRYLYFTLRFRAAEGIGYLIVTDLHQRSTTMQKEMERQYGISLTTGQRQPPTVVPPVPAPSTPVETLYWSWLPVASKAAQKPRQPTIEPVATAADARLVASTVYDVINGLEFSIIRR